MIVVGKKESSIFDIFKRFKHIIILDRQSQSQHKYNL